MKLALVVNPEDKPYVGYTKPILQGHGVTVMYRSPDTAVELALEYDGVICAQEEFLQKIVGHNRRVSLDNYSGSFFQHLKKPFVVVDPLKQMVTTSTGEFLFKRTVSKILKPSLWQNEIPFQWEEVDDGRRFVELYELAKRQGIFLAIDVETAPEPLRIQICSYSICWSTPGSSQLRLTNFTFWIDSPERYRWMELLNQLPLPKVMQNGIYDNSWFIYYGCPPRNWLLDTQDLFHCWYAELPKRLAFVTAFCVREAYYWKDLSRTGSREDFLQYGCMDVWATSCSLLYLITELPTWAWQNYLIKFPLNFPAILCGMRGWKIDEEQRREIREDQIPEIEDNRKLLQQITRRPNFNPGSWQQVLPVLNTISTKGKVLGTDKKILEKIATQHPFNQLICQAILDYKKAQKLLGSYIDADLLNGRFLFTLAPSGTDTLRMASHGSVFWTGNSIQVIPRGSVIKSMYVSDYGFYLGEPDAEQAEARCVAYLSGDESMIASVEAPLDYHRTNASKFFGLKYEEIDELIRDLSKRVNHGWSFNMMANMLLLTMGIKNVARAQKLLGLPANWSLKQVCQYLIDKACAAYPAVRSEWYPFLTDMVQATHKYTSQLGWTRFFFGEPWKDGHKLELNSLVAHPPQNLNVSIINESFLLLYEFEKKTNGDFKLLAQIHDSLPFQYKIGRLDLAIEATKIMERPYKIKDCRGKERTMVIPIALKAEANRWSELKKIPWRTM